MTEQRPIPENTSFCNSSSHTCKHLQIPVGNWNAGVDYCRYFKTDIDRDERRHPVRDDKCLAEWGR